MFYRFLFVGLLFGQKKVFGLIHIFVLCLVLKIKRKTVSYVLVCFSKNRKTAREKISILSKTPIQIPFFKFEQLIVAIFSENYFVE